MPEPPEESLAPMPKAALRPGVVRSATEDAFRWGPEMTYPAATGSMKVAVVRLQRLPRRRVVSPMMGKIGASQGCEKVWNGNRALIG